MREDQGMDRRQLLRGLGVGAVGPLLAGCSGSDADTSGSPAHLDRVRARDGELAVHRTGAWEEFLVRGVNLGMGKPGRFPGAAAITRSEYDRWLRAISELNANTIRIYTVHPPAFYEALADHNATADQPLYLLHGNWLPANQITEETTAYDDEVTQFFDERARIVVDVVNGNAELPERRGYAGGTYDTDVSSYVLGYVLGVEWEPGFVTRTNEEHDGGRTDGRFIRATPSATAFDRWLARRTDALATYAADTYDHRRPVSFSNWPTTDHLSHPAEPLEGEDQASVNPNNVVATEGFDPGVFATYHAYPYYPDFLNFTQEYLDYGDQSNPANSYAGYLDDLVAANDHPVVIGEFGVPSSRGNAHEHVGGLDQGGHTETEQGEYDALLFETIVDADTAGGIVFAWQDEWFKRTWNTMEYTDPNRRPFWFNTQSPEECYGLLGFDSGSITLSGTTDEWDDATVLARGEAAPQTQLGDGYDTGRSLREMRMSVDETFLHTRLEFDNLGTEVDWERLRVLVAIDTTPTHGNTPLPANVGVETPGTDFVVELGGPGASRVWVASHYDLFYYEYGERDGVLDPAPYAAEPDNGVYHPIRLGLSYPLEIPTDGRTIPFRSVETGMLRYGTADPASPAYDSLTDVHTAPAADVIELRLPWQLLNVRDPSRRVITGNIWEEGLGASLEIDDIGSAAVTYAPDADGKARDVAGPTNVTDVLSDSGVADGRVSSFARFQWDPWQLPDYTERRKESYDVLREAYGRY